MHGFLSFWHQNELLIPLPVYLLNHAHTTQTRTQTQPQEYSNFSNFTLGEIGHFTLGLV